MSVCSGHSVPAQRPGGVTNDGVDGGEYGGSEQSINAGSGKLSNATSCANHQTKGGARKKKVTKRSVSKKGRKTASKKGRKSGSKKKMKRGGSTCYRGAPKCGVSSNMADGPSFHPSWKQQGGYNLVGSTWGLDSGRNAGVSTQMESTSKMVNPPSMEKVKNPGPNNLQLLATQYGGKGKKQRGGSRTLDYSKWDGGPNQNPGAFWPFTGNAGVYTQLEASTPYGDSGEKVRGPRLGGINVRPGQIQGNSGERLQLLSTQAGGKKKSKGKSKTKTKSKQKKTKKSNSKKSKKSKTSTRKSRSKKKNKSWIDSLKFW